MPSILDKINTPFNNNQINTLAALCDGGRFPHALLITAPHGMGGEDFALYAACTAMCESIPPCGECVVCDKILRGIHPDVRILGKNDPKKEYQIDGVRAIATDVHLLPNEGKRKVYILLNADGVSELSQNAMLKFIEEPPASAVFILVCENQNKLIKTIISRVISIRLQPLSEVELEKALLAHYPNLPEAERINAVKLAFGNLGRAKELISGAAAHIQLADNLYDCIQKGDEYSFNKFAYKICKDKQFELVFTALKEIIIKNASKTDLNSERNRITPLQAVQIADIIDAGLSENFFNLNANLLAASITARIFKHIN